MRKILFSILVVLLLVVSYLLIFKGITVFGGKVLSIEQIKTKNDDLDTNLKKVSTLTSVDQPKAIQDLNDSIKQLKIAKEEYNDKVLYSSSEQIEQASQTRPYETEYLMTILGNHAKKHGVNLRYELRSASSGAEQEYDIYFTITASYVSISEFVGALENDSSLSFKIENFKLIPNGGNTENLQGTFTVRNINVKVDRNATTTTKSTN